MFGTFDMYVTTEVVPYTMPCIWKWATDDHVVAKLACSFSSDPGNPATRPAAFKTVPPLTYAWAMLRNDPEDEVAQPAERKDEEAAAKEAEAEEDKRVVNSAVERARSLQQLVRHHTWFSDEVVMTEYREGRPELLVTSSGPFASRPMVGKLLAAVPRWAETVGGCRRQQQGQTCRRMGHDGNPAFISCPVRQRHARRACGIVFEPGQERAERAERGGQYIFLHHRQIH